MAKLRFEIQGDPDSVNYRTFASALNNAFSVLSELDSAISGKSRGTLVWYVSHLSSNGTLAIDLLARMKPIKLKKGEAAPLDTSLLVTSNFVRGFENLERHGTSPPYISEFGLVRMKNMLDELERNGARAYRATSLEDGVTIDVSRKARDTIRDLLPADKYAIGSVEGTLEVISIHKGEKFVLYHAVTKRAVTCLWSRDDSPDMLKIAVNALGHRVLASGRITFNVKGDPVRVRADEIRVLGAGTLPTVSELTGSEPDLTDGLTTGEYLRSLRD